MSSITRENVLGHVQRLYSHVKVLADNHNRIIDHLNEMGGHIDNLYKNVAQIKALVKSPQ